MTWRRLAVLIEYLPPESATMTALRNERMRAIDAGEIEEDDMSEFDPAENPWSQVEMLLATLIDESRSFQHMYLMSHSKKGARIHSPERVRRPGIRHKPQKRGLTEAERQTLDPRLRPRRTSRDLAAERVARARQNMESRLRGNDG
jgi:hypothetical protein